MELRIEDGGIDFDNIHSGKIDVAYLILLNHLIIILLSFHYQGNIYLTNLAVLIKIFLLVNPVSVVNGLINVYS